VLALEPRFPTVAAKLRAAWHLPPLPAEKGLPTALQAQARKATLPITVEADGIGRYPHDTEAALYFCILEALQNIQSGQLTVVDVL
jgi:hypothetical protein